MFSCRAYGILFEKTEKQRKFNQSVSLGKRIKWMECFF